MTVPIQTAFVGDTGKPMFMLDSFCKQMRDAVAVVRFDGNKPTAIHMSYAAYSWLCRGRITRTCVPVSMDGLPILVDPKIEANTFCVAGE